MLHILFLIQKRNVYSIPKIPKTCDQYHKSCLSKRSLKNIVSSTKSIRPIKGKATIINK